MRKLVYLVASSIDGFVAAPDRSLPNDGMFDLQGDHLSAFIDEYPEMIPAHVRPMLGMDDVANKHFDTVVEGRVSYAMGVDAGVTNAYPHLRHYVYSTTLTESADPEVELIRTDPVEHVRALKAEDGDQDIWLVGGGAVAGTLRDEIDEIHLKLNPIVLGTGAPLVDAPFDVDRYTVEETRRYDSGVILIRYVRRR